MSWLPFNSVINSHDIINKFKNSENNIKQPIISEDELHELDDAINDALYTNSYIQITYYYNNKIYNIKSKILKIDYTNKKIILINKKALYYRQIIKIEIIN